jgi:hypothetical protein
MRSVRIAVLLALALAAPAALAQGRGHWRQHQGLHAHLEVGPGGLFTGTEDESPNLGIAGPAGSLAVALGGSLAPNVILGGELWAMSAHDPDLHVEGDRTYDTSDSSLSITGIGPNLTLYLAPASANLYLSLTPSLTWTRADLDIPTYQFETRVGLGLRFALGKEWWIAESPWGLGLSGHLLLSSNRETGQFHSTWGTVGAGINFSVSWN